MNVSGCVRELQQENAQLKATCQALAQELDEKERQATQAVGAASLGPMSMLTNDLARLQLEANDQCKELDRQLQVKLTENTELSNRIKDQQRTINYQARQIQELKSNRQLAGADDIIQQCQTEMTRERQTYENALEDLQRSLEAKHEEIQSYQAQMKVYMEDFEHERRDREHAQTRVTELQHELEITKELLSQFNQQHMNTAHARRQEAVRRIRQESYDQRNMPMPAEAYNQPLFRSRGGGIVVCDGDEERPLREDEDIIDSLVEPEDGGIGSSEASSNELQCPKCHRGFPTEQHSNFLEHIDACCT